MLSVTALTKSYAGRAVLQRLDFEVSAGQSVALIGANGSGKTTTLRCIAGLVRPDSGEITVSGIDVATAPSVALRRIGYLPQRPSFPATLTVLETLRFVARLRSMPPSVVERELEACAMAHVASRRVHELSGGERQRLALAAALLQPVDLYLFDEPSANLDPAALRILFRRAADLKKEGRTLLFTTHVPADLRHLATRVLVLADGQIQADGSGAFELKRYERLLGGDCWSDDNDETVDGGGAGGPGGRRVFGFPRAAAAAR